MAEQKVTVGRFVHVGKDVPCSLWVGAVFPDGTVNGLMLLPDATTEQKLGLPYSETPADNAWSWPPRV